MSEEIEVEAEACPVAKGYRADPRFNPDKVYAQFEPYGAQVDNLQAMLFFRRPIPFAVTFVLANILFCVIYLLHLNIFSFCLLCQFLYYAFWLIYNNFASLIGTFLFPELKPEERGTEEESNHIYPLRFLTDRGSYCAYYFVTLFEGRINAKTLTDSLINAGISFILFLLFLIINPIVLAWILFDLIICLPGVLFHPKVNPTVKPYLQKFPKLIGCPHCTPHFE